MLKNGLGISLARSLVVAAAAATISACSGGAGNSSALPQAPDNAVAAPISAATPVAQTAVQTPQSTSTAVPFSIVQNTHSGGTYSSTISVHLSKAPIAGHVLVLFFEQNQSANFPYSGQVAYPTVASGSQWSYDGATGSTAILHHVVQSGETGSYTLNVGGTGHGWADYFVAEVAGVNSSNPLDKAAADTVAAGTKQFTFGSGVTSTVAGTYPVAFFTAHQNGLSWSSISNGWTIAGTNGDFSEMIASGPAQSATAVNTTATLSSASSYAGAADVVLLNPTSGSAPTPSPAPSSGPTTGPTSTPAPTPTPGSGGTGSQYSYAGCKVYGAGDWFTTDVLSGTSSYVPTAIDGNSSTVMNYLESSYGDLNWYSPAAEVVNVTSSSTSMHPDSGSSIKNDPYNDDSNNTIPYASNFRVEGGNTTCSGGDCHTIELNSQNCVSWESYTWSSSGQSVFNGSSFTGGSGYVHNLNHPFNTQYSNDGSTISQAGLPMMGTTYLGEDLAYQKSSCQPNCYIPHAVAFFMPINGGSVSGVAAPSTVVASCQYMCNHTIKEGARMVLRSNFNCPSPGTAPQSNLICNSLKHYGMIMDDTSANYGNCSLHGFDGTGHYCSWGIRLGLSANGSNPWQADGCCGTSINGDLDYIFKPTSQYYMHISDFELISGDGA